MDTTTLKIALAGLLHDIGKIAQGKLKLSQQYIMGNADLYQPTYDGRHTHVHALYTAAFIEQLAEILPTQFNRAGWGEGDAFINLAACHHKPETAMQWLITVADRTSSGLDRAAFEQGQGISFREYQKTRLLPLFEKLGDQTPWENMSRHDFSYQYPLAPLSAQTIFPVKNTSQDKTVAIAEYHELFATFQNQLAKLRHNKDNDLELWANHLDSLLRTCLAAVPAARAGDVVPDVSLYDHCRTTASLAAALYQYHSQTNTLDATAINDGKNKKLLLITGDFYGIQKFIFASSGETGKYRSKLLRGRSLAVSLFSELAADMLCQELGLNFLSILFSAAGKFTLLAANTPQTREKIARTEEIINDWLFELSCGESCMGIALTEACLNDFHAGAYGDLHDRHMDDVHRRKEEKLDLERYGGPVQGYLETFTRESSVLCGLCGKRPATHEASTDKNVLGSAEISVCSVCRDHVLLGAGLANKPWLAIFNDPQKHHNKGLLKPIFNRYQILFVGPDSHIERESLQKLWQLSINEDGSLFSEVTMRPLNGYIPRYDELDIEGAVPQSAIPEKTAPVREEELEIRPGDPKTFTHIAEASRHIASDTGKVSGTPALGILKADVDNLALLMGCGLPKERYTITRLATLSRQLDSFFSIFLPSLLAGNDNFKNIYTVFAGGDDLFLIGPWNRISTLAARLRHEFSRYVCDNPNITFSAGITLHKSHTPMDRMAAAAESALEEAKQNEGKNAVTMFGQTVSWQDFSSLMDKRQIMETWLNRQFISPAMMYRFNHFVELAGREKAALAREQIYMDDLGALKWRAMFYYTIKRNTGTTFKQQDKKEEAQQEVEQMASWLDRYGAATRIPLWHLLYERR